MSDDSEVPGKAKVFVEMDASVETEGSAGLGVSGETVSYLDVTSEGWKPSVNSVGQRPTDDEKSVEALKGLNPRVKHGH